jgi:multiple sugar transport system substrate-binding protein
MTAVTRRRLVWSSAGVAGAPLALAACALPGTGAPAGGLGQEPITLRWSLYSAQPYLDTASKALPLFSAKHPQITVVQEPIRDSTGATELLPQLAGGSGPDVFAACCHSLPVWAPQGLLVNLDPLLKRDGKEVPLADYSAPLLQFWHSPERGQYALPMSAFTRGLFYNRTVFRRRGVAFPDATWDWNRFREAMLQLTDPNEKRWGWFVETDYERTGHYIRQNGGLQVDPKDSSKAVFDSPPALAALEWIHERMWKDGSMAKPADLSALGVNSLTALAQGNLALLTGGSWFVLQMLSGSPSEADQWDITVLPRGPAQRASHASTDGWAIYSGSKQREGAWALMKFLQTDAWIEPAIGIGGHVPARKTWLDRYPQLMKQAYPALADKNLAAFTEPGKQDYAFPIQLFKKHLESRDIYHAAGTAVFTQNERPVADTFRDAAKQINALNAAS